MADPSVQSHVWSPSFTHVFPKKSLLSGVLLFVGVLRHGDNKLA